MIRFTWLSGDADWLTYHSHWISEKCTYRNQFDYWFVLALHGEDSNPYKTSDSQEWKYYISLDVVAPDLLPRKEKVLSFRLFGTDNYPNWLTMPEYMKVETTFECSYSANIGDWYGDNWKKLMVKAIKESEKVVYNFDEYMLQYKGGYSNNWAYLYGRPLNILNSKGEKCNGYFNQS